MAFTETAADFINPDTPDYVVATIGAASVPGLFSIEQDGASLGFSGMEVRHPTFICASASVGSVAQGTSITINSVVYTVGNIYNDGRLFTTLELKI